MSSILIYKPLNVEIPADFLTRCFNNNHSIGFSFVNKEGKIQTRKNFKSYENFLKHYLPISKSPCLIHFAESENNLSNYCGPYSIDDNHVMIHSGKIWQDSILEIKDQSQSANLLKTIKRMWIPELFKNVNAKWLFEEALGLTNFMAIMNTNGECDIFNQNKGFNLHNCWVSDVPKYQYPKTSVSYGYGSRGYNYPVTNSKASDVGNKSHTCNDCQGKFFFSKVTYTAGGVLCGECAERRKNKIIDVTSEIISKKHPNNFLATIVDDVNHVNVFDLI